MTTAILINVMLAVAVVTVVVGLKLWAIRTQHHDAPLADRALNAQHRVRVAHRAAGRAAYQGAERNAAGAFGRRQTA